ncbi:MAG: HAMP domain-containing histidine kinase [Halobacteriovoraceae bacterium]|nr:HAMP domain-containing histidine kinase [Halobacteriovoraceae bacterium]
MAKGNPTETLPSYSRYQREINSNTKHFFQSLDDFFKSDTNFKNSALEKILKNPDLSVQKFLNKILCSNELRSYQTIQILVHKKGERTCKNFSYSRNGEFTSNLKEVSQFSSLFSTLKKSKNKIFDQTSLNNLLISSIGTFLAKTANFSDQSIILALSRNDFLRPTPEEINSFNQFSYLICFHLSSIFRSFNFLNSLELFTILKKELDSGPNGIFSEIKTFAPELYHFERLQVLGELLNTLKHELSNPLFGINLTLELLQHEFSEETENDILSLMDNCQRCEKIIEDYSKIYSNSSIHIKTYLNEIIRNTITLTKSFTKPSSIAVIYQTDILDEFTINTNPTWLSQVFFNLIINAAQSFESIENNKNKSIYIKSKFSSVKNQIEIIFDDNGPGIPDEIIDKIFQQFFTTKPNGTGLGLSVCKNLINKLDGDILLEKTSCLGTIFKITLPTNLQ